MTPYFFIILTVLACAMATIAFLPFSKNKSDCRKRLLIGAALSLIPIIVKMTFSIFPLLEARIMPIDVYAAIQREFWLPFAVLFFAFASHLVPSRSELYSSVGKFNIAYYDAMVVIIIGSILLTIYYCIRKNLGTKISISKLFILLLILSAAGFGLSYAKVGETTDVYLVEGYWHQNFSANLADLFSDPSNDFSNGSELVDLLQRNGIDNPITGEPIIIEHSPGNMIVEKTEGKILMKICLENGSLYTLF